MTTKVVRTRLNNRTISYAVAKHLGIKIPKDFKQWTWAKALTILNGKSAKAKKARAEFEKLSGYPVPNGSFRDLITGRVAKATPKKSKKSTKKTSKKETKVSKTTSKDVGIDYKELAKEIIKQQSKAEADKSARASREANDRYHSEMEIKRMGWSGQFKSSDKAKKPSSAFKKGKDDIIPKGKDLLKKK